MHVVELLIAQIAPHHCTVCGRIGSIVCHWCLPDVREPIPERCFLCKAQGDSTITCARCVKRYSPPKQVWVTSLYTGVPKKLIEGMKFSRKRASVTVIASLMAESMPYLPKETIITHIPTAPSRIRQRGYDQAQLIARSLANNISRSYHPLLRRLSNVRQVGATRATRLQQLEGAFLAGTAAGKHKDTPIVLVDDVTTTGGTLIAATKELRRAGYKNVYASVFCQKD